MSMFRRINDQFNMPAPWWAKVGLAVFYGVAFFALFMFLKWLRPYV